MTIPSTAPTHHGIRNNILHATALTRASKAAITTCTIKETRINLSSKTPEDTHDLYCVSMLFSAFISFGSTPCLDLLSSLLNGNLELILDTKRTLKILVRLRLVALD